MVRPFWLENFISKSVNLIPSPVRISAIPCSEERLKSFAKTGTSLILKLSITNIEFEILFFLIELNSKYPSSNPFIKLYLSINGFG